MNRKNKHPAKGIKSSNIHILNAMEQIVTRHVQFYQSDFYNYDIHTIKNTAGKTRIADRRFLWLPRRCGNSDPDNITGDLFALDYGDEYRWMQQYTCFLQPPFQSFQGTYGRKICLKTQQGV